MSAKRKRKKRKKSVTGSVRPEGALPQSAIDSSVDDGWGDTEEILSFAAPATEQEQPKAEGKGRERRARRTTNAPGEADTARLTDTIKELGTTDDRNRVFELLINFVAGTHDRVALFALKKGNVCAWKGQGLDGGDESAALPLSDSNTFNTLVENKSAFVGTDIDDNTKTFLAIAAGAEPGEIVAAPVAIGDRVVGVLYGDGARGTLFAQQLTMVTNTAGVALQRILAAAKKQ